MLDNHPTTYTWVLGFLSSTWVLLAARSSTPKLFWRSIGDVMLYTFCLLNVETISMCRHLLSVKCREACSRIVELLRFFGFFVFVKACVHLSTSSSFSQYFCETLYKYLIQHAITTLGLYRYKHSFDVNISSLYINLALYHFTLLLYAHAARN